MTLFLNIVTFLLAVYIGYVIYDYTDSQPLGVVAYLIYLKLDSIQYGGSS